MSEDFDDYGTADESTPAASSSLLAGIRERQAKAREALFFDYPVPKMEPLHVRYRPATSTEIAMADKIAKRHRKRDDASVIAEAGLLASCAVGVFDVDDTGEPIGDPDDWLTFGPELAELLDMGVDRPRAADVVRALYLREGDITTTFRQLVVDSGYELGELEETEAGN